MSPGMIVCFVTINQSSRDQTQTSALHGLWQLFAHCHPFRQHMGLCVDRLPDTEWLSIQPFRQRDCPSCYVPKASFLSDVIKLPHFQVLGPSRNGAKHSAEFLPRAHRGPSL